MVESREPLEHGIAGQQLEPERKRGGGDPAVGFMNLLAERVTQALGLVAQLGTSEDELLATLDRD